MALVVWHSGFNEGESKGKKIACDLRLGTVGNEDVMIRSDWAVDRGQSKDCFNARQGEMLYVEE